MMKILHISKYYPPYKGGIEDVCFNMVNAISGFEQKVLCFNGNRKTSFSYINDIEVIRAGIIGVMASQPLSICFHSLLNKYIRLFHPDIIHLHLPNPFACFLLLRIIPRTTKLILHWHSDIVSQSILYRLFFSIEKKVLERANKIIVTSPNYLEYSIPLKPYVEKAVVIPNIVSLDKINKTNDVSIKKTLLKSQYGNVDIIFFLGRHVSYKGLEYLLEAEKYITSDCVILIAGHGSLTNLLKKKAKSQSRIKFLGRVADSDIKMYMEVASVFAFPSITKNEAFGVVLAEAMYCGAVPVTFTIEGSGVNWVSLRNVTGLEVENKNAHQFGEAIDLLLKDSDLRNMLSKNARNRVEQKFTISSIKGTIEELYNSI